MQRGHLFIWKISYLQQGNQMGRLLQAREKMNEYRFYLCFPVLGTGDDTVPAHLGTNMNKLVFTVDVVKC